LRTSGSDRGAARRLPSLPDPRSGLRQYRLCESILRSEVDAVPERATLALFEQVRLTPDSV